MSFASANMLELLQIAESVANEKMIERSLVIEAIEEALSRAARMHYGPELDIRVHLDPDSGHQSLQRVMKVVEEVENHSQEISLSMAQETDPDAKVGDEIPEDLPMFDMDRISAQSAKQILLQKVREAERERQFEEFKDRVGTLIVGSVKREEYGNIFVDVTRGEAILRRDQKVGRETYGNGERLRAYIMDVRRESRGPQIFLSRACNEFMVELFRNEVPEIYEGAIEIRSVARDPGSRAKIAVISYDASIDPVGACVGMRGSRVQTVVNELQGERIDIIPWTDNLVDLVVSALQPAKVTKVLLNEEDFPREVVVPDDQLSLAIGRRGQNVRLACQLTGLDISIITETEERERREKQSAENREALMEAIDVDEMFAQLLVSEGFENVEMLAESDIEDLSSLDGIDGEIAEELLSRADNFIASRNAEIMDRAFELGLEDDLAEFEGLMPKMRLALVEDGIFSLDEFARCADWELVGGHTVERGKRVREPGILEEFDMSLEEAQRLIMSARVAAGILQPEDVEEPEGDEPTESDFEGMAMDEEAENHHGDSRHDGSASD